MDHAVNERRLNIGCGAHALPGWVNLDLAAHAPGVITHDIRQALPFPENSFAVVYHSHVLEHLPHPDAPRFLRECYRVLRPGGLLRVAVPDLETICRLYLANLEGALAGDRAAAQRYEWMVLELLDQLVRDRTGGEMMEYWQRDPLPAEAFVVARMGGEVVRFREWWRQQPPAPPVLPAAGVEDRVRTSGELHKWMYDRWSLRCLLARAGFVDIRQCAAAESRLAELRRVDLTADGAVRKPDSLFMEATKPDRTA